MSHNPLISIIIPIANKAKPAQLKRTLDSIFSQIYKNFETLVVIGNKADRALFEVLKRYPQVKILKKDLGKAAAQNYAAACAKGKYLLMHDVDTLLLPTALKEILDFSIKHHNYPVAIPKRFEKRNNYWIACRNFDFALYDKLTKENDPRFFPRQLFLKLNGYDPRLDPLDDWSLFLKLRYKKIPIYTIKHPLYITIQDINLISIARAKYLRGQAFGIIKRLHPDILSKNFNSVLRLYFKNIPLLLSHFYFLPGLFIIKLFNTLPLLLGIYTANTASINFYEAKSVAEQFEKKTLATNYGRYKHFCEITALQKLLPRKKIKILEVGAGTGRITKFLIAKGFKVVPTEASEAMLWYYRKKRSLPRPIKTSGQRLPFKDKAFMASISIRVVWHILDKIIREQFLKEITRVTSQEIILDITNKRRYSPLVFRILGYLFSFVSRVPFSFRQTYLFDISEFEKLVKKQGFEISEKIPLEVTTPFWLNLLKKRRAEKIFPHLYRLDLRPPSFIPAGRLMLKLIRKRD